MRAAEDQSVLAKIRILCLGSSPWIPKSYLSVLLLYSVMKSLTQLSGCLCDRNSRGKERKITFRCANNWQTDRSEADWCKVFKANTDTAMQDYNNFWYIDWLSVNILAKILYKNISIIIIMCWNFDIFALMQNHLNLDNNMIRNYKKKTVFDTKILKAQIQQKVINLDWGKN